MFRAIDLYNNITTPFECKSENGSENSDAITSQTLTNQCIIPLCHFVKFV
jgi:hypothetical protein